MKKCKKCGLALPPRHNKLYCVGPKHACWCSGKLNEWRLKNGVVTHKDLEQSFETSISAHFVISGASRSRSGL